jgi:hypothetical protein
MRAGGAAIVIPARASVLFCRKLLRFTFSLASIEYVEKAFTTKIRRARSKEEKQKNRSCSIQEARH